MKIKKSKLSNGAQLILVDLPDSTSVSAIIFAKVGSRYEGEEIAGISHFTEHCLFKGSKKYPSAKKMAFGFEELGAGIDAGTSKEYTYFMAKALKGNASEAIQILEDLYMNPIFPEGEIMLERNVILEEIRMYKDNPMDEIIRIFSKNMWKDQPIGRSISGTISSVRSLGRVDLQKHIQKYYQGESTQVVIAGDLSGMRNAISGLEVDMSNLPAGRRRYATKAKENLGRNKVICKEDDVEQAHLILGCYGVNLNDDDKFAAAVGNTILGQGMGSKLYGSLRHKQGLAYYVNSGNLSYTDSGAMYIRAGVDHRRLEKAVLAIKHEINDVIDGCFSEKEVHRAKQLLKSALVLELDSSDSLALYIGHQGLLIDDPLSLDEIQMKVDCITREDISRVFKAKFSGPKLFTMISPKCMNNKLIENIIAGIGE